ncbi:formylglycine-generating enzyme family protein [Neorhodopirellula pilleata]|uniref:Serine/threonine-protein kinase pkn1 n=1 Tax=Neorhodopirellula pilleata TaxID=2714738 RepID=A0A5C6A8U4_9BACT|nr:formylglycine-generating enzyme family protein [Neorhodopirellula pilleata]TWT95735.1 Serine/threonine-protein kinase pkn1 [Neorhodopirellula pilleata]
MSILRRARLVLAGPLWFICLVICPVVGNSESPGVTKKTVDANTSLDDLDLLTRIRQTIVQESSNIDAESMKSYQAVIPKTGVEFEMIPIPGGTFAMGSPADEADRQDNEGPVTEVSVSPFWMGKCEVTWDEYEPFMITQRDREKHGGWKEFDPAVHDLVDGVSQPTPPYTEMSFGMGQQGYPAICMTQHAANKYCQWLSAQTGHFYRLPTEAEWEYACRAGTQTAFSFGDEPIEDYAWFYDNSDDQYQPVGQKKPNPWGLHDMHGNVLEWTADRFEENYFDLIETASEGKPVWNPWLVPDQIYPRSVRGGSWFDDPEQLRSAYRRGSEKDWKSQDPQLPRSIWYHTDAPWLGFRIVRPLEVPTVEEMNRYWNSATGKR